MTEKSATDRPGFADWMNRAWVQALLVGVLYFAGMVFYQWVPGPDAEHGLRAQSVGLPDPDSYYHIKMGWLYATGEVQAAGADFHWMRESTWNGAFSDKDYLFHVYLAPFALLADGPGDADGLITGARLAIALLTSLFALALWGSLRALGARHAWLYTLVLTAVGGTYIVFRVNMCRSYMISISLALIGWVLLMKRARWPLVLVAIVFTLSYTASHLLLAMQMIRMIFEAVIGPEAGRTRMQDLRNNAAQAGCIALGIAIGCALHPQSLELMQLWWAQNVVVLALSHRGSLAPALDTMAAFFGMNTAYTSGPEIALGMELLPPSGAGVLTGAPVMLFAPMLLPLASAYLGHRPTRVTLLTAMIAIVWFAAWLINQRFIEYAAPFSVLACGLWITELMAGPGFAEWRARRPLLSLVLPLGAAGLALVATGVIWVASSINFHSQDRGLVEAAGRWLHDNPQAHGKVVFHDRWDDFTKLIFYASECDYITGLDPTFMLLKDRERYTLWMDLIRGKQRDLLTPIRDTFGADYILFRRSSSEYAYHRLAEEARAGRLEICIRADDDAWTLYRIVR